MYKNATLATPVQTRDRRYSFANKSCYSSVQLILKTHYSYSLNKHVLNTWPQLFLLTSSFHWSAAMELQLDTLVSADRIEPNETYLYHKLKQYCGITTTTCEHLWEKKIENRKLSCDITGSSGAPLQVEPLQVESWLSWNEDPHFPLLFLLTTRSVVLI